MMRNLAYIEENLKKVYNLIDDDTSVELDKKVKRFLKRIKNTNKKIVDYYNFISFATTEIDFIYDTRNSGLTNF
jgi:hypothetical protein